MRNVSLAIIATTFALTGPASAAFLVTVEAPRVQTTSSTFAYVGTETFNGLSTGANQSFTTSFGTSGANTITGTYSGVQINAADQYGGAGGTGNYATTFSTAGYSLSLSSTGSNGVDYFGYWLSALDSGNQVSFYKGQTLVYTFSPAQLIAAVNSSYNGNPNAAFSGQNSGQPYAFVNFYDQGDTFDRIVFQETPAGGGYESDNHTVGSYTSISGTAVAGVPEPATWISAIIGFGVIGVALRKGRKPSHRQFRR